MVPTPETLADALRAGVVLADGGLSTLLEAMGHDIAGPLWSAALLAERPDAVRAAHAAFARAGARVATTASYQASFAGFARAGFDAEGTRALLARSVRLAREGAEEAGDTGGAGHAGGGGWVAGSVGPFGAHLAGGQEYTGEYVAPDWPGRTGGGLSVAELTEWHLPTMAALVQAGADVLACETVPAAAEAEALLAALQRIGAPGWLALTTVTGPDGVARTRRGEPAEPVFAAARGVPEVLAVGVNCLDPAGVPAAVRAAAAAAKPIVVYPNSGETWDAAARTWRAAARFPPDQVQTWVGAGARLVGGCCRVGPALIAALGEQLGH